MEKKNRGLGRGLSALMSDVALQPEKPNAGTAERLIPIDLISPNPDQPRRSFSEDALAELSRSIAEKGILQPLILRKDPARADHYQIVAGERRWRAAQRANLHEVPAITRELNDVEVLEIAIIENIQRADLNALEEAQGYKQLVDRFGHTQEQLAKALGKSRSHIANHLRLLTLPEGVLDLLSSGQLTAGHARTLVGREDAQALADQIVKDGSSVREAEKLTKRKSGPSKSRTEKDADTIAIENELSAHLKMPVSISPIHGTEGGTVTLKYRDYDQLDDLLRLLSDS